MSHIPQRAGALPAWRAGFRRLNGWLRSRLRGHTRPNPRVEAADWSRRLAEEQQLLLGLVHGMEKEFLETGTGLEQLARQLTEIRGECRMLTDLALGQSQDAPVQFAFQLLKKAEDLVLASYEQYDHVFAMFKELRERLARLSDRHADLMRILLPLNFITMTFRIEASRHPIEVQEAFFTLAARVNTTVNDVRTAMERQFSELAASEQIARLLIERISDSIKQHRADVVATLNTSRDQLRVLSEALISCKAGSAHLAERNIAVNRHIGGIVIAQQCHDITRQKIEHVAEAMADMRAHLAETDAPAGAPAADARHFVLHAGQIQLQQVHAVFQELNEAAYTIKTGITNLRLDAGAAADAALQMGATTVDANVARQCQTGITEILGIVEQSVQKIADIVAAFEPLQASFVDCTGKAASLATDVRHAGLNAQVFAIHAPDGATLEVLAGRVRLISEDVIREVEEMRSALNHTAAMIQDLRQRLEDFRNLGRGEEAVLIAESALSRQKLADLEKSLPLLIQRINHQQEGFAKSVENVLVNVRFPAAVAAACPRALQFFKDLVAWGAAGAAAEANAASTLKIDSLKSKYTMASERHAHASALDVDSAPSTGAAIELFDEPLLPAPSVHPSHVEPPSAGGPISDLPAPRPDVAEIPDRSQNRTTPSSSLGDNVELF